ncbi:MAG TPA: ATP-binding protein [Candidatus Babeliales bacterium]|nr:ATP-binding protein [Candidatus Babeliales bacterium]
MKFYRNISESVLSAAKKMPVISLLGPRQSGKTTLAQELFGQHKYVSLEDPTVRAYAINDPQAFLATYHNEHGIIIDEVQHAPELLSYIQVWVDANDRDGYFVITGSQNILINEAITQSLAGRVAIFTLLPLSVSELKRADKLKDTSQKAIFFGGYPRIYAKNLDPAEWAKDYIRSYVERDVRSLKNIADLSLFQKFMKLCAGRIGQLLNIESLANDCGITAVTVRSWLSVLEATYIIFLLQPYSVNIGKRLVKAPKLYFYDTALASSLLGIETEDQLSSHYLHGGLFESFVLSDILKQRYNRNKSPNLYFWRDYQGHELDGVLAVGNELLPIEIKAGQTIQPSYFSGLRYWYDALDIKPIDDIPAYNGIVVYAGKENQQRTIGQVLDWKSIDAITERLYKK